ncbi:MAG: P-loop NTPase [Bacteroidetes bacterium]|nr:P-loop NTPase [Bacteroidota bacterium]
MTAYPELGGIISGDGEYLRGTEVTITATPETDYQFINWTEGGSLLTTETDYTFEILSDRDFLVLFSSHPDEKYYIFGSGGGQKIAEEYGIKLLGQIPLVAEVGEASEKGLSIYEQNDKEIISVFENISKAVVESGKN